MIFRLVDHHFSTRAHSHRSDRWPRRERATGTLPLAPIASNQQVNVGRALRALRAARDLSIRALAEKSGLSVNTLSLIENGKTSPCVATLQQLALAPEVPITAFFENGEPTNRVSHIKASQGWEAAFAQGMLKELCAGLTEHGIELLLVTVNPSMGSGAHPIVHTGHEFVFCLEGRITYMVQDQTYLLKPGDSLLFESHLPHGWHNVIAVRAKMLLVLCPADARYHPTPNQLAPDGA